MTARPQVSRHQRGRGLRGLSARLTSQGYAGVRLAFPLALLVRAAEDGAAAGRPRHHVDDLVGGVVGARLGGHVRGLVPHDDDLAAGRRQLRVHDPAQPTGHQTGGVDDDVGLGARVAHGDRVRDVLQDAALQDDAVGSALAHEPGQVQHGVDTDGAELAARGDVRRQLVFR